MLDEEIRQHGILKSFLQILNHIFYNIFCYNLILLIIYYRYLNIEKSGASGNIEEIEHINKYQNNDIYINKFKYNIVNNIRIIHR